MKNREKALLAHHAFIIEELRQLYAGEDDSRGVRYIDWRRKSSVQAKTERVDGR